MATSDSLSYRRSQDFIEPATQSIPQPAYPIYNQPSYPNHSQPFYVVQPVYPTTHVRPSYSQGSQNSRVAYSTAYPVPAYIQQYQPAQVPQAPHSKSTAKPKRKYYKPVATETFVLSLFLLGTLIFIGGIEFILRRGVPITADSATSTNTTTLQPQKLLSKLTVARLNDAVAQLDYGSNVQPEQPMSCIGIEMIISVVGSNQCSASLTTCTSTATYTKPIYNKAIPTMPCYACAMQAQGIHAEGFVTVTTTHCETCETPTPATVYPCSTCKGTILDNAPQWQVTPTQLPRLYTEYSKKKHSHAEVIQTAGGFSL